MALKGFGGSGLWLYTIPGRLYLYVGHRAFEG
jgi:hypothetical protein